MIKRNTTIGNYSYNMVGTSWEAVTDVVIIGLIARHLSLGAFGDYSFVMAFVAAFRVLCGVSLPVIVTREIAVHKEKASEVLTASLLIQGATSAATFGLV
ncbi:MAG: oligosaccharide flippase family protein, partial [Deltaproteobacteria bacterium]|nr:oligosaccharide flippase family protein [Deltaproteobacteria bacterium]